MEENHSIRWVTRFADTNYGVVFILIAAEIHGSLLGAIVIEVDTRFFQCSICSNIIYSAHTRSLNKR